jgi:diketogulonate reductase-like aldo/keto reductase
MNWSAPAATLNNGVTIPLLGFGVFQTPPAVTTEAVAEALRVGYRLIDTAAAYLNEREVGQGIARSGVERSDLFVTTKLWLSDYGYDSALRAFDVSSRKLGLEYVDLYLLHQPLPSDFEATIASYRAAERLLAEGRVRAIGVSNFSPERLERLISQTSIVPAVNQVEVHPYFAQPELRQTHKRLGVLTQAWSPLGQIYVYQASGPGSGRNIFDDPVLAGIATANGKTVAQVILRWHLQHGTSAIPKSVRPARIAEDFDIFDFELTADEMTAIDALDTGVRGGPDPASLDARRYAFRIPD